MSVTIVEYLLKQLKALGIRDIFGVPGDYAFAIDDAIENEPELRWIGCCNELNAAYAADGYARIRGMAALCTTFGVGELSAIGAIAGAFAEHLPIIHLVGMPSSDSMADRRVIHHTLGSGRFDIYAKMAARVACAWTVLTPDNAVREIKRVLTAALYERQPVYLALPLDYAQCRIEAEIAPLTLPKSDPEVLATALKLASEKINEASNPVVLPGYLVQRLRLEEPLYRILEYGNLPFATMMMDKGVLNETSHRFLGFYDGELLPGVVHDRVEHADCLINIGALWSDFNTGNFSAKVLKDKLIVVGLHQVKIGDVIFHEVEMADFVDGLAVLLEPHELAFAERGEEGGWEESYADCVYRQLADFIVPGDILVAETGTVAFGMMTARLPHGVPFVNQTLWGAIGWATPAAFGAALAAPERRTILLTGEGAHQLTAQEVSQFGRFGLRPLILVVNNDGYLIERLLDPDPDRRYNDLPRWDYQLLPAALGCREFLVGQVHSSREWEAVLARLKHHDGGAYIEIVMSSRDVPEMARRLKAFQQKYYR
ncbi:alpha-keto acid decarboxylase family protein [Victivallis sp. Marseille-Q1083]|uniref:alpha-keto acid decarboxylase family protein n=1 Tax=Victivallis sp. Marseille-Q1083 TaxID=2717288 RepID=UPI00158ED0F4|nr:thiamine pyrophosphate-binding protein [Victivallis sp. Marseille-Q1083]